MLRTGFIIIPVMVYPDYIH